MKDSDENFALGLAIAAGGFCIIIMLGLILRVMGL